MKFIIALLCLASTAMAEMDLYQGSGPKIAVKNTILAKVNDNTISVIDVMKKLDMILHQNYPQFADDPRARFQFYTTSWRQIFMEMIDTELMLSDAAEKEVKLSDGEVREEMESRFGPNSLATLDHIGLSYEDAWKMVKNELIVRRMMWFFVQSKALQSVSPQAIRDAYRRHLADHPPFCEWTYRVISIRPDADDAASAIDGLARTLAESLKSPDSLSMSEWESAHPGCKVQISNEFVAKDQELSESHRSALSTLAVGEYSQPVNQVSRADNKSVYRIFYLAAKNDHPAPSFESLSSQLKGELIQKATVKESEAYMQKLRKHYGFDPARIKETVPDDLQPFFLE